ncbi:MAG: tetratricopeptide repeat protein [Candidatus Methanoperedens sp.]
MDSIEALAKVYDSLSCGASALDFSISDITGECAAQVQKIIRLRKSGAVNEDVLNRALSCLNDGNGLIYLGLISAGLGHWNCSIKAYEKALLIFEKLGDVQGPSQTYNNLGLVYADMGEWSKAIEFYQKSLETKEKLGDVQGAAQTYNNLGLVYADMGEWSKAIEFYQKSLETFENLGDVHGAAQTYTILGSVYADMGEWDKAIEYYQKSLEISEKFGDVHVKGITLTKLGKLHLDKKPPDIEVALGYLEEGIKLINKEARPHYPNALNWLALCCHRLGSMKKSQAKGEKDHKKREELVNTAASFFSVASEHYSEAAGLPRVNIPSLWMYAHLDKGLSYSVKNITERDESKALKLLDSAKDEFKQALKFADETNRLRLQGIIYEHEAKLYIRRATAEKSIKSQNKMLDKAVEALQNAVGYFEKLGDEKQCDIKTCDGCRHLFKGLRSFRMGIKDNSKKLIGEAVSEIHEARLCYDGALNELGKDTVDILNKSFDYVDKLIESEDKELTTKVTREFIKIIDEISSTGLQKIVKMYTFDESMNVKGNLPEKSESPLDKLGNPASIAAYFGWLSGVVLLIYGYALSNAISAGIGIILFLILVALKLKKK